MAIPLPRSRRTLDRHRVPDSLTSSAEFHWPGRKGEIFHARLRDVSFAGLSLQVTEQLPGLEIGECLRNLQVTFDGIRLRGELLLMHITPLSESGSVCGGLFYPAGDADVLALRKVVRRLESLR